jgi:hypothetical protein
MWRRGVAGGIDGNSMHNDPLTFAVIGITVGKVTSDDHDDL